VVLNKSIKVKHSQPSLLFWQWTGMATGKIEEKETMVEKYLDNF
jgi:hypothetical protein